MRRRLLPDSLNYSLCAGRSRPTPHKRGNYTCEKAPSRREFAKLRRVAVLALFTVLSLTWKVGGACRSAGAEEFRFKYQEGEKYRILSTVSEDVLVNGRLNNHSEIVNRISAEVTATGTTEEGIPFGTHKATFMTSEEAVLGGDSTGRVFTWGKEYVSEFDRDALGYYTIADEFFMPVVRNVPVFPEKDVAVGKRWYADGEEVHDLRRNFNIQKPFKVPFTATYTYAGVEPDTQLHRITAEYTLYTDYPVPAKADDNYPVTVMGFSRQTIYFNNEEGKIDHYTEQFRIVMETKSGDRIEYRGIAKAEVTESTIPNRAATVERLQNEIESLGIENTAVTETENGITISIENIQFLPESSYLMASEKQKLRYIAELLSRFPDNDLLVTGHTARSGSEESCQALSEKRAASVAQYLQELGVKDEYHLFTRGLGSRAPIADNSTEAGMARNRRVEITIIE